MIQNSEKRIPISEDLTLTVEEKPDPFWKGKSFEDWEKFYEPILKTRGAKW
jgi:hypothetical protein